MVLSLRILRLINGIAHLCDSALKNAIITGYSENGIPTGLFKPNNNTTKAEAITMLFRAVELKKGLER